MKYSKELQNKIIAYYEKYYKKDCNLKDYKERALQRLEEECFKSKRMEHLQKIFRLDFHKNQKHFFVGAGTGGGAIVLFKEYDCDVYGIEPSEEGIEIIQGKCREVGINHNNFKQGFGENISFPDNYFDVVHCFTVLEHVQDVEKTIQEMIRVTKPGGIININTSNRWFPAERHYKILFPTFLPKQFGYFCLFLLGKSHQFLKTINFLSEKKLNRIFYRQKNICWYRVYETSLKEGKGFRLAFLNFLKFNLCIYPNQEIVIQKL